MKHLFSLSAYDFEKELFGGLSGIKAAIKTAGADGVELLTGHFEPDLEFKNMTKGVHLPYATDWYAVWCDGKCAIDKNATAENILNYSYGQDPESIVNVIKNAISSASALSPAYGVFHACSVSFDDIISPVKRYSDEDVLKATADIFNSIAMTYPNGEPPFRILFENLWWPGLKVSDDSGYRILADNLDFDNWGLCIDTGHLINEIGGSRGEDETIDMLTKIFDRYPQEMKDRVMTMHLHHSIRSDISDPPVMHGTMEEMFAEAYRFIISMDQHRHFTRPGCKLLADILQPEYITHELPAETVNNRISIFEIQRSFF